MKCTIPEISWHNREPVLSVHIQPIAENFYRLATGGADSHVLIWQLVVSENGAVKIEALSDLTRHQKAVNSVRWSPNGHYLATADDDANIIIWHLKTDNIPLLEGETSDKETWVVNKIIRGHKEDIYDLCWAPNGLKLLSGSIDNTAILWDFTKGNNEQILSDHKGFVQGVCWDPKGLYIATISTDRICRIYENTGKQVKQRIQKGLLPVPEEHYLHNKEVKFFHDDTFKSFFRRLDFSPDGTLLVVPSGRVEIEDCNTIFYCTYLFSVGSWTRPVAVLPTGKQCSTVVRFCPVLYELHEDGPESVVSLPYRMILAVAADHDIILYDTQQIQPFAYFKDIHYTRLTDLSWSSDGQLLIASSTDGYCSLITFEEGELGTEYIKEESEVEESFLNISGCEELDKDEPGEVKPKKMSFLQKWTVKTPKKDNPVQEEIKRKEENQKVPKRIKPVPVADSPKRIKPSPVTDSPKRIKPVPVVDKKATKEPESTSNAKKAETTPKMSPLLSFLQKNRKEKTESEEKLEKMVLDELEARDAWQCEPTQEEDVNIQKTHSDDLTEDFSFQLDDSKTVPENNLEPKLENQVLNSKNVDVVENIENCNSSTKNSLTKEVEKVPTEEKPILPRRVPLITLSSPKHKKKPGT